ncbi:WapI family immunity protein [Tellurirhabdus bombi]|uniref:WapI family immunity protein n=1 Tax=Tellurirhabdus bombi TaxID=2907205 RepID=UPI001F3013F0|nr:hypothetical protein [Tellurirhabdus bombi]
MRLTSSTGTFEFKIIGYSPEDADWRDRNSLLCELSTVSNQEKHTQETPIRTWELNRLLENLQKIANQSSSHLTLNFSEPGLSMELVALPAEQYHLQVQLDHDLTPSWHPYNDFPCQLEITLSRQQLQEAIHDLARQLEAYPER